MEVRRSSGLVVPSHIAAAVPDVPPGTVEGPPAHGGVDSDGRRRIVFPRSTRKLLVRLVKELEQLDLALDFSCRTVRIKRIPTSDVATGQTFTAETLEPIAGACGEQLKAEGEGTHDPGLGCACTRVHFVDL